MAKLEYLLHDFFTFGSRYRFVKFRILKKFPSNNMIKRSIYCQSFMNDHFSAKFFFKNVHLSEFGEPH